MHGWRPSKIVKTEKADWLQHSVWTEYQCFFKIKTGELCTINDSFQR